MRETSITRIRRRFEGRHHGRRDGVCCAAHGLTRSRSGRAWIVEPSGGPPARPPSGAARIGGGARRGARRGAPRPHEGGHPARLLRRDPGRAGRARRQQHLQRRCPRRAWTSTGPSRGSRSCASAWSRFGIHARHGAAAAELAPHHAAPRTRPHARPSPERDREIDDICQMIRNAVARGHPGAEVQHEHPRRRAHGAHARPRRRAATARSRTRRRRRSPPLTEAGPRARGRLLGAHHVLPRPRGAGGRGAQGPPGLPSARSRHAARTRAIAACTPCSAAWRG